jgi:hypothetical protein
VAWLATATWVWPGLTEGNVPAFPGLGAGFVVFDPAARAGSVAQIANRLTTLRRPKHTERLGSVGMAHLLDFDWDTDRYASQSRKDAIG